MEHNAIISLDEQHSIILEIMKDIDRFCRANDIPYTISAGTLLGAVRHGGFIPWDDDADLFMLREDFDRFVQTYRSDRYILLYHTDADSRFSLLSGFAKVCDPSTMVTSKKSATRYGIFVDVFPLDDVPEEPREQHERMHAMMRLQNRLHHRQKSDIISVLKSYRHSAEWWWQKLYDLVHDGRYAGSPLVAQGIGTDNYRTVVPRQWFETLNDIVFEGHPFPAFKDTHAYLTMLYGNDYMTPKRWNHGVSFYATAFNNDKQSDNEPPRE